MASKKKDTGIHISRGTAFLLILISIAALGVSYTLGTMQAIKISPLDIYNQAIKPRNNIGKKLREKEAIAQKKATPNLKEKDLTFYKTLTADKPMGAWEINKKSAPVAKQVQPKETTHRVAVPHTTTVKPAVTQTAKRYELPKHSGTIYTIQVAAFQREAEAMSFKRKMERKGHKAYIVTFIKDGSLWYRVRIGTEKTLDDARRIASRVLHEEGIQALIIRIK